MSIDIIAGDCRTMLATLADGSVQTCVTSPPYANLRNYGHPDQIGAEATAGEYIAELVNVFRQVRRVLRTTELSG
jgi:DNA modification methylase